MPNHPKDGQEQGRNQERDRQQQTDRQQQQQRGKQSDRQQGDKAPAQGKDPDRQR